MKATTQNNSNHDHEEIADLAKQIWEREGRQANRDLEYWLRAEEQMLSSRNRANSLPGKPSTTGTTQVQRTSKTIKLPDSVIKLMQNK